MIKGHFHKEQDFTKYRINHTALLDFGHLDAAATAAAGSFCAKV